MTPVSHGNHAVGAPITGAPPGGRADRHRLATGEIIVGAALVAMVAAAGAYFSFRPGSGTIDGWIQSVVTRDQGWWFSSVTWLRYPVVIVAGSVIAAAVTARRDRPRALACLLGPPLALVTSELVVKPLVGRSIGGVLSYPSGSTVGAAALATVAVLATPARWRMATAVVASLYALWMALAVVSLQWHFPTDALGGLAYGVGVVLMVDGSAWSVAHRRHDYRWRRHRAVAPEPVGLRRPVTPAAVADPTAADGSGWRGG